MTMVRSLLPWLILGVIGCSSPSPNSLHDNNMQHSVFDLQGHRGARGLVPENTIPAFLKALDLGVTTLEMDAVISADSQVVLSHEPWMSSAICSHPDGTPVTEEEENSLLLFKMTAKEIASYDCGKRGHALFPEQSPLPAYKPLLQDVIREVNQYVKENGYPAPRYNIEIKSSPDGDGLRHPLVWKYAQLLYDVIASNGLVGVADVQSFDPRALEAMHAINPNVGLVWLISNQEGFEANMAKLTFTPNVYSPNHNLVDSTLVEQVHAANMKLIPWTVNEVERIQEIIDLGADGLITDYPDRAKLVLASSNQ